MLGFPRQNPNCSRTLALRPFDVLVAGAGPAGVALAMRLKRLGYEVALIAAPGTSAHRLETLNPAAETQLALEGLALKTEASRDFEIRWGTADFEARTTPSFLVERQLFQERLRRFAIDAGIRVFTGRAQAPAKTSEGWRISVGPHTFDALLLADATGRRGMVRQRRRRGPPLISLHSVWAGEKLPLSLRVEAVADAWIWGAPTPDGHYAISIFQDPRHGGRENDLASRVAHVVARAEILKGAANLRMMGNVIAEDATPSEGKALEEKLRLFRVGDAALVLDPLSSSGVQSALQSALDAAIAIHTSIQDPSAANLVAEFLDRRSARRAARHAAYTGSFYRTAAEIFATPFWTSRAGPALSPPRVVAPTWHQRIAISPEVRLRDEPCLIGNRIAVRRVVALPASAEPVAFVEGVEIASLFDSLSSDATTGDVIGKWSANLGEPNAIRLFRWAWGAGILISKEAHFAFRSIK